MGLSDWFARLAVGRAHVLVVAGPGSFRLRVLLEQAVQVRGWVLALTPADADVLAVCGARGIVHDEPLAGAVPALWDAMVAPRVRVDVVEEGAVEQALDRAAAALLDTGAQRDEARRRRDDEPQVGDMDHGDMDHGDMDHGDMDHGDMDHGDMEMAPHGIALAGGSEDDRDGLEMDVLHVPLGPVLPCWPPGLVLRTTLYGDVIGDVEVELPASGPPPAAGPPSPGRAPALVSAMRCDAVADVLTLAGWPAGAVVARRARDAFLAEDLETGSARAAALRVRVRRHRPLGWMLAGLGTVEASDLPSSDDPSTALLLGDVRARLLALLDAVQESSDDETPENEAPEGEARPARGVTTPWRSSSPTSCGASTSRRPGWSWPAWTSPRSSPPGRTRMPEHVTTVTAWWAPVAAALVLTLAALAAVLHGAVASAAVGRGARAGVLVPVRETARLLRQQPRVTVSSDRLLGRIGAAGLLPVALLMAALVPLGAWTLVDSPVGVVWFNALDVMVWGLVWLAGWGPNAAHSLVGGYRFLALALGYELPLMFALVAPPIAAGSLRVSDVAAAQDGLWFVVWMPVAFLVYCLGVLAFSLRGPFATATGTDLAGGVLSELGGGDRLLFLAGRYALLTAGAAFAVPMFLGGGAGPLLPEWLWVLVKTVVLLAALVGAGRWLPALRPDRFLEAAWVVLLPLVVAQDLVVAVVAGRSGGMG